MEWMAFFPTVICFFIKVYTSKVLHFLSDNSPPLQIITTKIFCDDISIASWLDKETLCLLRHCGSGTYEKKNQFFFLFP